MDLRTAGSVHDDLDRPLPKTQDDDAEADSEFLLSCETRAFLITTGSRTTTCGFLDSHKKALSSGEETFVEYEKGEGFHSRSVANAVTRIHKSYE